MNQPMRAALPLIALLFTLAACGPKDEGTPLPTRTSRSSEGGFGGLNKQKQQQVPDKPLQYDPKHFAAFGLAPYPKPDESATSESYSTDSKSDLKVKFKTHDSPDAVKEFYIKQIDGGNATANTTDETTVINGKTSNKSEATILISTKDGLTLVTIQASKTTQFEAK